MNSKKPLIIIIITALLGGISYISFNPNEISNKPPKQGVQEHDTYDRNEYGPWKDVDRDCQNTRHEVLIGSSAEPVQFKTEKQCLVVAGKWIGLYTGKVFTNARKIDIDHVVPLKEAHISGASGWTKEKKRQFANDADNLLAVSKSANRSKGAKDPAKWMPKRLCEKVT